MKRNKQLARAILNWAEDHDTRVTLSRVPDIGEYDRDDRNKHIYMLIQAGFLDGLIVNGIINSVGGLTWAGHDLLEELVHGGQSKADKDIIFGVDTVGIEPASPD